MASWQKHRDWWGFMGAETQGGGWEGGLWQQVLPKVGGGAVLFCEWRNGDPYPRGQGKLLRGSPVRELADLPICSHSLRGGNQGGFFFTILPWPQIWKGASPSNRSK